MKDPYPPAQKTLFTFGTPADIGRWTVFSDADFGGPTIAALAPSADAPVRAPGRAWAGGRCRMWAPIDPAHHYPPIHPLQGTAVLEGSCAPAAPDGDPALRRGGFAGINAHPSPHADAPADLSAYDTLALRVRGDGRPYIASLRTENWLVGGRCHDVWQAFLFAPPGAWHEARLPFHRFLLTHRGRLVEAHTEMNAARVVSIGVALAAGGGGAGGAAGGPFALGLDWIRVESAARGGGGEGGEGGKDRDGGVGGRAADAA